MREHGVGRVDSTMNEGRFQGEGGKARRASLEQIEGSMSGELTQKVSRRICIVLVSLQVWPNMKWDKRLGDEKPAHKMKE